FPTRRSSDLGDAFDLDVVGCKKARQCVQNVGFVVQRQYPPRQWTERLKHARSLTVEAARTRVCRGRRRQYQAEAAATSPARNYLHRVSQQPRQPSHDRQANAQPLGAVAARVIELVELVKDAFLLLRW